MSWISLVAGVVGGAALVRGVRWAFARPLRLPAREAVQVDGALNSPGAVEAAEASAEAVAETTATAALASANGGSPK